MNILLLTYQGDMAGSTNSIFYLAKGMSERGHLVVAGIRKESLLYSMLENGAPKVILASMTFGGKLDKTNMRQIKDVVEKYNIQIVNAQSSRDRYTAIFANWWFGLKTIVLHTRRQRPMSMGGYLQRLLYVKGTKSIITVSHQLKETFIRMGYPADHLKVIFNGLPNQHFQSVDDNKVAELRSKYDIREGDVVIGCVSRMKEQAQIIAALPLLPENGKVLFVGIDEGSLDVLAKQHKVKQQIIYAGKVDPSEALNYYKLFSVNILPSTMDGFGLTLIEAMALGVPVVATRSVGIIDVLDNQKNGLWFEDGNIKELADKILVVLQDESRRNELIQNGYKAAYETFSLERTLDNYEAFFQEMIQKYPK